MPTPDGLLQGDLFDAQIIPAHLAVAAMRDSGYKNTAYALAELIDNSIQAEASMIEVLCIEKREQVATRKRSRLWKIAVIDNGSGMDDRTLRMALQFGNGTRLNDRTGIGRFGMGLPNASISQAGRIDVWSWQNGPDNAIWSYIDVEEIKTGDMTDVPEPSHAPVPEPWRGLSIHVERHGTLVVWSNLDIERLTWKQAKRALHRTAELSGRIYRRFIADGSLIIRLYAQEDGEVEPLTDEVVEANDPMYLSPLKALPPPFDARPMFELLYKDCQSIEYKERNHTVTVRYSVASDDTIVEAGTADRGNTKYGKHAANNIGISVLRAGREIMFDPGWVIGYDPRERWWSAEVEFPPELDEIFGVTNNKQAATHFAELAKTDWRELAEEGEDFIHVVSRLKSEGDPRGSLLTLSDSIHRTLQQLREMIKGQGKGKRSSRRERHDAADELTDTVNQEWKKRSREKPLEEDSHSPTERDLDDIRNDLTQNKKYSLNDAENLVLLIRDADLRVVFLEEDFPDSFQLFNVEMKGYVTEITFNRKHPAFDDVFGTLSTDDEDMNAFSTEDIIARLRRAVNAAKIIFAAWARYEREAGIDRAKALQRVRFEWGQIAATFLQPGDDLVL